MPILKFNKCDYDCRDIRDKRGRVYCRRVDPKCGISGKARLTPTAPLQHPLEKKYAPIIQQVIAQYPKHRIHGRQFYILDGQVIANRNPAIKELKKAKEIILVHSHSALNWEKWIEKYGKEEFQTFTDGDIDAFRKGLKEGWLTGEIVIMADGRMDFIGVSPHATREQIVAFLNLGPKTIGRDLNLPEGERIETGDYPFARKRLRVFAAKYGLNFQEGLHWL